MSAAARLARRDPVRRAALWTGAFLVLWWIGVGTAYLVEDEGWLMQVVERVRGGEVLYRDVFFNVPPLTLWIHQLLASVFGNELLVLRGGFALVRLATLAVGLDVLRRLGVGRFGRFAFIGAGLLFSAPTSNFYVPVAHLAVLTALWITLRWWLDLEAEPGRIDRLVFVAGAAGGVAFASKHSIGLYVVPALTLAALLSPGSRAVRFRRLVLSGAGYVMVLAPIALWIWATGAWARFVEFGFLNRGTYVRVAELSYMDLLREWWVAAEQGVDVYWLDLRTILVVAPLAIAALALGVVRTAGRERLTTVVVAAFVGASVLDAYPRPDFWRFMAMAPALMVGAAVGLQRARIPGGRPRRIAVGAVVVWLVASLAYTVARPAIHLATGETVASDVRHVRAIPLPLRFERDLENSVAALERAEPTARPMFIRHRFAGVLYLISGLENPTPYDFPTLSAIGLPAGQDVVDALESGRIRTVCYAPPVEEQQRILLLEEYMRVSMVRAGELPFCGLFRRTGDPLRPGASS